MLNCILRLFFKAEFLVFQEVMGIINDQWPTLSKERNKIAEALWAASNVSLTKSKFYQVRECSGTSTPEREREDTQRGPCFMGQTGRWNATSCASYRHAEAHCRFCWLQNLLGELWEHTPGFVGYNDHRSCTLLLTGRKKHPPLKQLQGQSCDSEWLLSFVHLSSILFSLLSSSVGSSLPSQYPLKALRCSKSILVTFISQFISRITVRIWGFSLKTNPVSQQKSSQDPRCFWGIGTTVMRTRTVFC